MVCGTAAVFCVFFADLVFQVPFLRFSSKVFNGCFFSGGFVGAAPSKPLVLLCQLLGDFSLLGFTILDMLGLLRVICFFFS